MTLLVLLFLVPAVVYWLFWSLFPTPDPPPRWRVRLALGLEHLAHHLRGHRPPPYDPFDVLRVQTRLGAVADHVRGLENDKRCYARAERIIASQLAYDQLLAEACRMAGVEVRDAALGDAQERFREEVELTSRGWAW